MAEEKKKIKVGINGIGITGRSLAKFMLERNDVELVAINDPLGCFSIEAFKNTFEETNNYTGEVIFGIQLHKNKKSFYYRDKQVRYYAKSKFKDIPWGAVGAQIVVECNSIITDKGNAAAHLSGGAKKVIIAAPSEDAPMFVVGVNDHEYTADLDVVSSGSSTINALAPLAKVIDDRFGIVEGLITTIHAITATQKSIEAGGAKKERYFPNLPPIVLAANNDPECMDVSDIRSTLLSRVSSSCAAKDVGKVIPSLNGKLAGMSVRVDTIYVSVVDLTLRLKNAATYEDIKNAIKEESVGKMKGILRYTDDNINSVDVENDPRSCIFNANAGIALGDNFVKLVAWFDDRSGYFARVVELIISISSM